VSTRSLSLDGAGHHNARDWFYRQRQHIRDRRVGF
jgi:hypothetical protein